MPYSKKRLLGYAVIATILVGFVLALVPFFGSLKPSAKADAVYSQARFPASALEDLQPGEARFVETKPGGFYLVASSQEVREDLDRAADLVATRAYRTFDDEYDAYIVWSIAPKKRGANCAILHMEKNPNAEGIESFGGFFDPCSGVQFDYAGRVSRATYANNFGSLRKPEFKRVSADTYQITNLDYLMGRRPM